METRVLQIVLENCLTPAQIKRLFHSLPPKQDPYAFAIDAILDETDSGMKLCRILDEEAAPQRELVRSRKVAELRENLTPDCLEPDRKLGLILWALLRDDRMNARAFANELAERLAETEEEETSPEELDSMEDVEPLKETESIETPDVKTLDQQIAESDESQGENVEDDIDLDALMAEIKQESGIVENGEEEDLDALLDEPDASLEIPEETKIEEIAEEEPLPQVEINDDLLDEVDEFIATLDDDPESDTVESGADLEEFDADALIADLHLDEVEEDEEIEIEIPEEEFDFDTEMETTNESETLDFEESDDNLDDMKLEIPQEEMVLEDASQDEEIMVAEPVETGIQSLPVPTVKLGGINISLSSLKRACENVFNEPVELVTDENLTRQDQIVVVGRQCGVRILHGPTWTQPTEPFRKYTETPITINPGSLKLALSRIYEEPVELIPDEDLLARGTILFTGKSTGIAIMENPRTCVPLPDWAIGLIPSQETEPSSEFTEEITHLRERMLDLQARVEILESQPPAPEPQPVEEPELIEREEPLEISEPVAIEEPVEEDGHISEEPVAMEDLESEELEPVFEHLIDQEEQAPPVEEDELIASTAEEETPEIQEPRLEEEPSEEEEELNLDDFDLDSLDLGEIEEEEPEAEPEKESAAEDGLSGLDELNLDELEIGEEEGKGEGVEETGNDLGEEELNLDDLDLEGMEDDYSGNSEEESDHLKEPLGEEDLAGELELDSSGLEDVDLEGILSELDAEEDSSGQPEKVFNGETILLLGGEPKNKKEYIRVIQEVGGICSWYADLSGMPEGEIAGLVEQSDMVMALSSGAVTDPGILQAIHYAEEQSKPLIKYHSSSPVSVQKQLVKFVSGDGALPE